MLVGTGSVLLLLFAVWQDTPAQPPGVGQTRTIRGTIDRFTTAKKGEVDGCYLDDGTWVHWPPHLEERFKAIVARGDRIEATGRWERGKKGETKFEAQSVVNLRTDKSVLFDYRAGAAPPAAAGTNREERLRALERQLEGLLREIKELRRAR